MLVVYQFRNSLQIEIYTYQGQGIGFEDIEYPRWLKQASRIFWGSSELEFKRDHQYGMLTLKFMQV